MINSHINRQWQEQIVSQLAVKFSMGITGNNGKAETAEDLNEYFCRRIIPNLRSSTDAQRCFLKNKPMGKDSWTHDPVEDVSCSFTNE